MHVLDLQLLGIGHIVKVVLQFAVLFNRLLPLESQWYVMKDIYVMEKRSRLNGHSKLWMAPNKIRVRIPFFAVSIESSRLYLLAIAWSIGSFRWVTFHTPKKSAKMDVHHRDRRMGLDSLHILSWELCMQSTNGDLKKYKRAIWVLENEMTRPLPWNIV